MPISDLLAEITGGKPSPAPAPKPTAPLGVKRKAEESSNGATSTKLTKSRQPDGSYSTSKVTRDDQGRVLERSYSLSRPATTAAASNGSSIKTTSLPHRIDPSSTNGRSDPLTSNSQRITSTTNGKGSIASSNALQQKRASEMPARPKLNPSTSTTSKVAPPKPSPTTSTMIDPSRAPKRGSFKEIMARGAKAQETMGKVGMIQHKAIDKAMVKKEREITKPDQKSGPGSNIKGKTGTPYTGSGRPSTAPGRDTGRTGTSARDISKNGPMKDARITGKSRSGSVAEDVGEKKLKKAAAATTGYAGTARPRAGASSDKRPSRPDQRPRHGGLLEPPRLSRRDREDEYDDDLDDFIDYDEEEEEDPGSRHRYYDSDGSSDMEAGLSDIDTEERKAELFAREEDRREQALEEKLRREKEERRRRLAQGGR